MEQPRFIIEEVTDSEAIERNRRQHEQFRRNSDWLQAHWNDVLPAAYGKFVAVAGQEVFVAESIQQAWEWVETVHPDDKGAWVRYVRPPGGPRIYTTRG
jgi:hypothetical protein